jgi:outer membrane protein OmpA-like peptidoglycan-associated protein
MAQRPIPSRLSQLLAAVSGLALVLAAPSQAQVAAPAQRSDEPTGKRVDHSRVRALPLGVNTEREGPAFGGLSPSALTRPEVRMVTPAAAPTTPAPAPETRTAIVEDKLDSTNFESGRAELLPRAREQLIALAERMRGKQGLRFEIVGHTDNQRISQRLKAIYPDNQALS